VAKSRRQMKAKTMAMILSGKVSFSSEPKTVGKGGVYSHQVGKDNHVLELAT
jgi:hypothetical protein